MTLFAATLGLCTPIVGAVDARRDLEFEAHRGRNDSRRRGEPGGIASGRPQCGADPAAPQLPAEQAAASDPATPNAEDQDDQQQAEPVHDNGPPWPFNGLDLPPAPFDVPPPPPLDIPSPVQVTVS